MKISCTMGADVNQFTRGRRSLRRLPKSVSTAGRQRISTFERHADLLTEEQWGLIERLLDEWERSRERHDNTDSGRPSS